VRVVGECAGVERSGDSGGGCSDSCTQSNLRSKPNPPDTCWPRTAVAAALKAAAAPLAVAAQTAVAACPPYAAAAAAA